MRSSAQVDEVADAINARLTHNFVLNDLDLEWVIAEHVKSLFFVEL